MHKNIRLAALLLWLALGAPAWAGQARWVLVDTETRTLTVLSETDQTLDRFNNISVGRGGVAPLHYHGEETTPLGDYRIIRIRPSDRFNTFFELDYPTPEHAEMAVEGGQLDADSYDAIVAARLAHHLPPQDTVLGGRIGIHGVGRGDGEVHSEYDWTEGCIALTNSQLRRFAHWAKVGMRVVIR
ncbi:L,D-transpeptidase [Crenobacter sp. SG2303]|uniref:L,D-transpeptidase n=1 Tax=Crenobacter oryzisoli TaxID=3056844 RepID=A0ABT7XIP9_9NEIS|nr:L,D-transpeptidase [Crenobacter sp. SG2303]MDN0073449.1 L,D-transpeptidase [Crenobacter sp. SG2303]